MTDLDTLRTALAALPLGGVVRVQIGAAWEGEIRIVDLLNIQPLQVLPFETTDNLRIRLSPGGTQVGVLPRGTRIDILPGADVASARVVLWVARDFIWGV